MPSRLNGGFRPLTSSPTLRRDMEIQIAFLALSLPLTLIVWYFLIFRSGKASEEYKWESSDRDNFNQHENIGWWLGWVSSFLCTPFTTFF